MADSQRHLQLDTLASILKTTSIATCLVCASKVDISGYSSSALPLVEIVAGSESPQPYQTGRMALWKFNVELTCYFLGDNDWEQGESLLKEMKDALGGNTTLNGYAITVNIKGEQPGGGFPLYSFSVFAEVVYERKISEA